MVWTPIHSFSVNNRTRQKTYGCSTMMVCKMKETDPSFAVAPWIERDSLQNILKKVNDIPKVMRNFKTYFSKAQVKTKRGRI